MGQLRDRMDQDMVMRGLSPNTRRAYLRCAAAFVRHFMRPPTALGSEHMRAFLLRLIEVDKCSASIVGVYVGALK